MQAHRLKAPAGETDRPGTGTPKLQHPPAPRSRSDPLNTAEEVGPKPKERRETQTSNAQQGP